MTLPVDSFYCVLCFLVIFLLSTWKSWPREANPPSFVHLCHLLDGQQTIQMCDVLRPWLSTFPWALMLRILSILIMSLETGDG